MHKRYNVVSFILLTFCHFCAMWYFVYLLSSRLHNYYISMFLCFSTVVQPPQTSAFVQKPKQSDALHFHTTVSPGVMNQAPPQHQQNVNHNWSGNQPQQHQQQQLQQQMRPIDEYRMDHQNMAGMGGAHHAGGGVQRWSNEVAPQPVRNQQSRQDSNPMGGGAQGVGGWDRQVSANSPTHPQQNMLPMGGVQQRPDQSSATPPKKMMRAWGENQRQQSNESTQPQSPAAKPKKTAVVKSQKELRKLYTRADSRVAITLLVI